MVLSRVLAGQKLFYQSALRRQRTVYSKRPNPGVAATSLCRNLFFGEAPAPGQLIAQAPFG